MTYEWLTDTYTFWWPRPETWIGSCRILMLELDDGSVHPVMLFFGATETLRVS